MMSVLYLMWISKHTELLEGSLFAWPRDMVYVVYSISLVWDPDGCNTADCVGWPTGS